MSSPTTLPDSGDNNAPETKHASIQLSLELERQLELEGTPPTTPSASASRHSLPPPPPAQDQDTTVHDGPLDPQVLAHIVAGLRKTIEDMTRERNDLVRLLEGSAMREASLQDTLELMTEKATGYEEELSEAKKRIKQDEEDIALLRHKVEESRRGLMRLQAESRRQSAVPGSLDLSRANIAGFNGPASSKRASFTPLTGRSGNGHRRVSSISVDGSITFDSSPSLNGQAPSSFNDPPGLAPPSSSRRSLFKYSPPTFDNVPLPSTSLSPEVEALKKEVESLKKELSETRIELSEANEGKEASELCVHALRSFIEVNQVGENGPAQDLAMKLPPPPSVVASGGVEESKKAAAGTSSSGWGFKLWKGDNTVKSPVVNTAVPPSTAATTAATSPSSTSSVGVQPTPTVSAPFSRLGGFFSSRTSSSSVTTTSTTATTTTTNVNGTTSPNSSLQTNAASTRPILQRDSISGRSVSVSDTSSSFVEPLSPEKEREDCVDVVVAVAEDGGVGGDATEGKRGSVGMESVKMVEGVLKPAAVVG